MASNQRPMDDSKVSSAWGIALQLVSSDAKPSVSPVSVRARVHRLSPIERDEFGAKLEKPKGALNRCTGEAHHMSKLSDADVRELRREYLSAKGEALASGIRRARPGIINQLADKWDMSYWSVKSIVSGRSRKYA